MAAHHAVEFGTGDILAASADDVLLARNEIEIAVRVPLNEITGEEPAVAKCGARLLRIAKVALHDDRCLDDEFAHLINIHIATLLVHDTAFRPRTRRIGMTPCRAHASGLARAFERIAG